MRQHIFKLLMVMAVVLSLAACADNTALAPTDAQKAEVLDMVDINTKLLAYAKAHSDPVPGLVVGSTAAPIQLRYTGFDLNLLDPATYAANQYLVEGSYTTLATGTETLLFQIVGKYNDDTMILYKNGSTYTTLVLKNTYSVMLDPSFLNTTP